MTTASVSQVEKMDRMYRYTRYVYDLSRKYYLFGRDRLINELSLESGQTLLEVGCGTGRNLIKIHKRFPDNQLYGLDAANVMIETAEKNARAHRAADKLHLTQCLAEQLTYDGTFGLEEKFDVIVFSYSLSMIPTWHEALDTALANLKQGGTIYIVDFWDQQDLPSWFAAMLKGWLDKFHVHFKKELLDAIEAKAEAKEIADYKLTSIGRRYAYLAEFKNP